MYRIRCYPDFFPTFCRLKVKIHNFTLEMRYKVICWSLWCWTYPGETIEKVEWIGHVLKRVGSRLRALRDKKRDCKLSDGKSKTKTTFSKIKQKSVKVFVEQKSFLHRDSSSYGVTAEACFEVYGKGYEVAKEDCVRYIQESRLWVLNRKKQGLKLSDGKSVGEKWSSGKSCR
jgi:hypothetical protein